MTTQTNENLILLDTFCDSLTAAELWLPSERQSYGNTTEAELSIDGDIDGQADSYKVLARYFHNSGPENEALKIYFWAARAGLDYIGAIGYHRRATGPYFKNVSHTHTEEGLYRILGGAAILTH